MLQRNAPLPTRFARCRARVRRERSNIARGHGHSAIARKPACPLLVARMQGLLDQQAAEARAVDEEITCNDCAVSERNRLDPAIFAAQPHVDDLTLGALDTSLFREAPQIGC